MNKNTKCYTMEELIKKAKHWVSSFWGSDRQWLEAEPRPSYNDSNYIVRLCVLEGSPAKGYLVIDFGAKAIKAFNGTFGKMKTFRLEVF